MPASTATAEKKLGSRLRDFFVFRAIGEFAVLLLLLFFEEMETIAATAQKAMLLSCYYGLASFLADLAIVHNSRKIQKNNKTKQT